jgi:hypothetical protein
LARRSIMVLSEVQRLNPLDMLACAVIKEILELLATGSL